MPNILDVLTPKLTDKVSDALCKGALNTFLNPYSYLVARNNNETFKEFTNIYIDGGLLVTAMKILRIKTVTRVSFDFTSIADTIFTHCIDTGKTIYFVGSKENEIVAFTQKIKDKYPTLQIAGFRNGYFDAEEKQAFSEYITHIQPDIIICGMGTPHQENLLLLLRAKGWNGTGFTCGGFFHQTASSKTDDYYPPIIDKMNLRWLYRIYDEPKLLQRYLMLYPLSLAILIKDKVTATNIHPNPI